MHYLWSMLLVMEGPSLAAHQALQGTNGLSDSWFARCHHLGGSSVVSAVRGLRYKNAAIVEASVLRCPKIRGPA